MARGLLKWPTGWTFTWANWSPNLDPTWDWFESDLDPILGPTKPKFGPQLGSILPRFRCLLRPCFGTFLKPICNRSQGLFWALFRAFSNPTLNLIFTWLWAANLNWFGAIFAWQIRLHHNPTRYNQLVGALVYLVHIVYQLLQAPTSVHYIVTSPHHHIYMRHHYQVALLFIFSGALPEILLLITLLQDFTIS